MVISILRASQSAWDVVGDGGGHQYLLRRGGDLGQRPAPRGVQFGEHVVEQQHRVTSVGPQQLVGRQPQGKRHRPRFSMACKAFRDLVAEA